MLKVRALWDIVPCKGKVFLQSYLPSVLGVDGCLRSRPGRFTPGNDSVPIVCEKRWAPGPVWTCAKNLAPAGIQSPNSQAL
jgi:hypothetical protein